MAVDWGTLIGTGLGAAVGIGATLFAERSRWKRDQFSKEREVRRQLYAEYLAALSRTRNQLRDIARSPDLPADERAERAGERFRSGGAYELRHQMAIVAPEAVVGPSERALRRLRDLSDSLEAGAVHPEERWTTGHAAFGDALEELRTAMRKDLHAAP
ncbi:hypothetical protein GCM10010406_05010 [Streptomyces thermolineatus]|uniref:Secreted protein n=1 Tax=Streptomyces thermolineatus TaxID=44033 RepID=A0ABN3KUP3_9ACTN